MSYLCKHGYMFSSCQTCVAIEEAVEEFLMAPPETTVEDDYMYDVYLEMDERRLSETEEN